MIDTCQASSMYEKFYSPNILAMASSLVGEDSLSVKDLSIIFYYRKIKNNYNIIIFNYLKTYFMFYISASRRSSNWSVYNRSLYILRIEIFREC